MKKWGLSVLSLITATSLVRADFHPPFQEGEDLLFQVRWGVVTGGYATLSVPSIDMVDGKSAYHILSEARSTGMVDTFYRVRDKNEAWLDTVNPRSLRYSKAIREGKYSVNEVVELDQAAGKFHETEIRHDKNDAREDKQGTIPANVLDVLSSLYYVRSLPLEVGKSFTVDVHSGDKTFPLLVKVNKLEKVRVKAGKFLCYRVEPMLRERGIFISKGKKLEVWLTADDRHMPVLMRSEIFIGHVSAELVKCTQHPPADTKELASHAFPVPTDF
jgi:hypothetical protein